MKTFLAGYLKGYDAMNWFVEGAAVSKLQSFGKKERGDVLSVRAKAKPYKYLRNVELSCSIIRTVSELSPGKTLILAKDIPTELFLAPPRPSIGYFFVLSLSKLKPRVDGHCGGGNRRGDERHGVPGDKEQYVVRQRDA